MNLSSLFSSKRHGAKQGNGAAFKPDPRRAQRFFEHAEAVADARNYDYAIECYVSGLRYDPDNVNQHEALRQVALRRKVAGGKPAGIIDRYKPGGSAPVDRMLHTEALWSKDPLNVRLMREFMQRSVEADEALPDLNIAEVAYWAGELVVEFAAQSGKPNKRALIKTRDLFARVRAYGKAVEVCKMALRLDPNDDTLLQALKDLEAEQTMQEGGYSDSHSAGEEGGGFRESVRDADEQAALEREDRVVKRKSDVDQIIEHRRAEFDEDPEDLDRRTKLVDALLNRDEDEAENEAIELLNHAWNQSGQYRYKMRIGDIYMRQYNRHLRELRKQAEQAADAAALNKQIEELTRKKLAFELEEYQERVKHYPTDQGMRFELGRRLYHADKLDEAISAFQQAKADPKHRAPAHQYLGTCYIRKGWLEEAIDTLRGGIEAHDSENDQLGLDLRYLLMDALERQARDQDDVEQAREAQKIASQILQTKIGYRDIQSRLEKLRELVDQLQKTQTG